MDSKLFIGRRSELAEIEAILQTKNLSTSQQHLILAGKGGIGKTQIAVAFATLHHHKFSSVFWLDASSEDALKTSFQTVAEAVFDVRDPTILAGKQSIVHTKRWLSDNRNTNWLLIFDNYDDPKAYHID